MRNTWRSHYRRNSCSVLRSDATVAWISHFLFVHIIVTSELFISTLFEYVILCTSNWKTAFASSLLSPFFYWLLLSPLFFHICFLFHSSIASFYFPHYVLVLWPVSLVTLLHLLLLLSTDDPRLILFPTRKFDLVYHFEYHSRVCPANDYSGWPQNCNMLTLVWG